jgi:hypothetical protein
LVATGCGSVLFVHELSIWNSKMTIKKLIQKLKQMPKKVKVIESGESIEGHYYVVYRIRWMDLQK